MAKNPIQFQKGLSLTAFLAQYGDESKCYHPLFTFRWPQGFVCPKCGHTDHCQIASRKVLQCNYCHTQTSLTAGTIFASTKLPLTVWFLAIYLISQAKNGISSLHLGRTLGVSANTALRIKHKLQQTMKERDDSQPLHELVVIDDAYWGGKKYDGVRGRGATGKTPFVASISLTEEGHPVKMRLSKVIGFTKEELTGWAKKHLNPDTLVVSDGLNCFPGVEDADCEHEPIISRTENGYDEFGVFKWVNIMIGSVKNALHGTYHHVSPSHLPRYLAEFCYRFNRRFELHTMVDRLAYVAMRTPPMPQRLLKLAEVRW
ncbi:IS1595 family transposase [Desulfogranum marinum]|uniref:IS1595 family transposase n=1 Tax=Desulfogranum marinum TaxID=453220 RepID=UPI0029C66478|nr:IS1595 family transposase [Desulfogranum marinum]